MSQTYPDYYNTTFPDAIDSWDRFLDPDLTALQSIKLYSAAMDKGDLSGAKAILESSPRLKNMVINADNLNKFRDALLSLETLFMENIQEYLVEIVKYKQEYSSTQKYKKYDTVYYLNQSEYEVYMCITNSVPIGSLPTDLSYWIPLTMRGPQGVSGTGLSPKGVWNALTTYTKDDLVSYNNCLWAALRENAGIQPKVSATADWYLILEFSQYVTAVKEEMAEMKESLFKIHISDMEPNWKPGDMWYKTIRTREPEDGTVYELVDSLPGDAGPHLINIDEVLETMLNFESGSLLLKEN